MTRDRLRIKMEVDDRTTLEELVAARLAVKIVGKDGRGTNVMTIDVWFDTESNSIKFMIKAPEEWEGGFNDYMIENMVLQRLSEEGGRRRR